MKRQKLLWIRLLLVPVAICWSLAGFSQTGPAGTVPVSTIVSVEAKHGGEVPTIARDDVRVYQGKDRLQTTAWVPLQGDKADLELYLLIDDAADPNISMQYDDLRQFINSQPATTAIAVGYIRFGMVEIVQKFTKDRSVAAKALRLPTGVGVGIGSPYVSVGDVIKHWPASAARHEIVMITSGIDERQDGPSDPYLVRAVEQAQHAGVQIYAIYASGTGHVGHTFWRFSSGQNNLSFLADETGGEFYGQGFETPVAFKPFLDEIANRLRHQYLLTFLAKPETKTSYQHIRLETEVPNTELVTANKVYVPAAK